MDGVSRIRKISLYIPEGLALQVAEAAEESGVSKSACMRRAMRRAVGEVLEDQATFQVRPPSLPISSD